MNGSRPMCLGTDRITRQHWACFLLAVGLILSQRSGILVAGPLDTLQPGYWYEIPNSKLTSSGVYPPSPVPPGATGPTAIITAWNGGAFDTLRNRLVLHGGGHGDYAGNELYTFDLNSLTWARPWGPTPNSAIYPVTTSQETYNDGNPSSVHTYSGLLYLPNQDRVWRGGGSLWSGSGGGSRASWYFDFATLTWQRRADSQYLGVTQVAAYDSATGHIFAFSDRYQMTEYDPSTNTWTLRASLGGLSVGEEMTGVIDPVSRVFVAIGNGHVIVYDLAAKTIRNQTTNGASAVVSARGPGLTYDSNIQKIVGWAGGTSVYSLNTSNWTWTQHSPNSSNTVTPSPKTSVGVFTRFQYVPSKNLYVVVNSVDTSIYAFKLSAGGSSTPPPGDTTAPSASISSPANGSTVLGSVTLSAAASDNIGVAGVQFKLDGANLGSEDTAAPFSVSWNTTSASNGAHSLTVVVRDAAGNVATATPVTVTVSNSTSLPPPTGGTWTNKGTPPLGSGPYPGTGGKHSRLVFDSTRGRIVFTGGDYSEPNDSQGNDGNARIWSMSTASYATNGAWTSLHPFCSGSGQLMPGRPDNVGWVYDSNRDRFYTLPGFYFSTQSSTGCEGGGSIITNGATQFSPATGVYGTVPWPAPTGGYGGDLGATYAVYDPTGDRVYRFRDAGSLTMEFLNVATNTWGSTPAPNYADVPNTNVHSDQSVIDVQGRAVYCYLRTPSSGTGYLLKYNITSNTFSRIPVPSSVSAHLPTTGQTDIESWMAFDPTNRVILIPASDAQYSGTVQILGIYNVDSGAWTTSTPPSGIYCNLVGFDSTNGVMVVMGRTTGNGGGPAPIYFYQYGAGSPPSSADTTAPTVNIAAPSNGATVSGSASLTANASDNLGVIGVQFKLDGANLGAEDTTAPYTVSWNTTTSGNGSRVLAAVARDAAGNQTVSSPVTVTVSNSSTGNTTRVTPSDNWCSIVNSAAPGSEVVFAPGNYSSTCWFTAQGSASAPIVARSEDLLQPAVFNYSGSSSNLIELHDAAYFTIRGFSFGPTQDGVDAIRIWRAANVVIEQSTFQGIGGVSISANTYDSPNITVRKNTFRDLKYTALYFGCQDGECKAANVLIEQNLIDGVTTPYEPAAIGYGVQIKLNSYATIRDNTIYRTKGPGIMVYGSNQGDPASIVEGNYVEGSATDGGIVIGGGPAIVRNNILVKNSYGGISAQNYNGRNLQQNVWIVNNTILDNADSGINVSGWSSGSGNVIAFNAISPRSGVPALSPSAPTGTVTGNVTCSSPAACFVNGSTAPYDLWPTSSSPLLNAAGSGSEGWRPVDDFMGIARGSGSDVGAFETPSSATSHLVGGTSPRPVRISGTTQPPPSSSLLPAPTNLQVK